MARPAAAVLGLTLALLPLAVRPGRTAPRLPPPLPAVPPAAEPAQQSGNVLVINGRRQQALWRWQDGHQGAAARLWLPLEVLQNQLGVSSRSLSDGGLDLEWFGQGLKVPAGAQQALDDEVAIDALPLLQRVGVSLSSQGRELQLELSPASLLQVRAASQGAGRRIVLDLSGPTLIRQEGSDLLMDLGASGPLLSQLQQLGLASRPSGRGLALRSNSGAPQRVFTLGSPNRVVIDLPTGGGAPSQGQAPAPIDPRLQALLGRGVRWERLSRSGIRLNLVRIEPRNGPLRLTPLAPLQGMEGLLTLTQLAQQNQALVAINGGYFNRVRQLPLGALKKDGRWLSGPILNRGVAAWSGREPPRFGRLNLQEWAIGSDGQRLPLVVVNSGYVQRGVSRYDAGWGPAYRSLSGAETAVLVRQGVVRQRIDSLELERGVPLRPGDTLLVGRGGVTLPWGEGTAIRIDSQGNALAQAEQVIGGGPLLLQNGRVVLNGGAENFSAAFLRQGAPRTVLASDGLEVWLVTLEGEKGPGPTLEETARVLLQLGARDALNLDGGSSTGLVLGGSLQVKGRGVAGRVHNGVGLIAP